MTRHNEEREVLKGCGDSSCIVAKPSGMATNGGCRCEKPALRRAVLTLRAQLHAAREAQDEQRATIERLERKLVQSTRGNEMALRELQAVIGAINDDDGPPDDEFALGDALESAKALRTEADSLRQDLADARSTAEAYRKEWETLSPVYLQGLRDNDGLRRERDEACAILYHTGNTRGDLLTRAKGAAETVSRLVDDAVDADELRSERDAALARVAELERERDAYRKAFGPLVVVGRAVPECILCTSLRAKLASAEEALRLQQQLCANPHCGCCHVSAGISFAYFAAHQHQQQQQAPVAESPTWPYVLAFARIMEAKLAKNRHKGNRDGWLKDRPEVLLKRLREETAELKAAISWVTENKVPPSEWSVSNAANEAADVANFAMMITDVCGGLDVAQQAPEKKWDTDLPLGLRDPYRAIDTVIASEKALCADPACEVNKPNRPHTHGTGTAPASGGKT